MTVLRRSRAWPCRAALPASAPEAGAAPSPLPTSRPAVRPVVLEAAALQRLFGLDPQGRMQLLERIFTVFENSMTRMLPELVAAGHSGNFAMVLHVAHTLKSSTATVGADVMSRLCADIETRAREQRGAGLNERIALLLDEAAAVRVALHALLAERRS